MEARSQQSLRDGGYYSHIHNVLGGYEGVGARTQEDLRKQDFYSRIHHAEKKRLGDLGDQYARTQAAVRQQGLYSPIANILGGKTLSGYLGDAAAQTVPGLLVAAVLVMLYFLFLKKSDGTEKTEPTEFGEESEFEI